MADEKGARFIFVKCGKCSKFFQVERIYWEPRFDKIPLRCSHCSSEFPKEEAAKVVGV